MVFGHQIEVEAIVVAREKLKERTVRTGGEGAQYQVAETWRFVLDVPVQGGDLTRVQHDEEFRGSRYHRPAPGDTVTVAYREGHPDKLRLVLKNSRFDVIYMAGKRDETQHARDAEAVRSAMERPAGSAPQARHDSEADGAAAGGSPGSGTRQPGSGRRKVSAQDKLLKEKLRLARDGSPGTATILALGHDGARTATIRVKPDSGETFETTIELLKGHVIEVGQSARVRFNPAHHSRVVLLNIASVGGLWHVPAHCPDCGAPVDQAVASVAAHPVCAFCHHSIPCDPS